MGIALSKSQAVRPDIIVAQLAMQNFTMLKVFLSASLTSILSVQFLIESGTISPPPLSATTWAEIAVGGSLVGIGMLFSGACPGTVLAQVGLRYTSALYTLVGGLTGALAYTFLSPYITPLFQSNTPTKHTSSKSVQSVDEMLGVSRRTAAIITACSFASILFALESIRDWQTDAGVSTALSALKSFSLLSPVWSPYLSGLVLGLLQIPSFIVASGLGASSGYVVLLGHLFGPNISNKVAYLKSHLASGPRSTWQLCLDIGIVLGAAITYALNPMPSSGGATNTLASFLGGFSLIIGARIAGGCTSGHGLTGIAKLALKSFLAVGCMFGAGIAASLAFRS
jgi:uncharacterized membrane protein YedE/YeeE